MKRTILALLAGSALLALPAFGLAATKTTTTVKVSKTSLGKIAVKGSGFTLYIFTRDKTQPSKDNCYGRKDSVGEKCQNVWPPFIDKGKLVAGKDITASKLGTIKLPNGKKQVTYYGHPLYGYSGDFGPGDSSYVGANEFGGFWYAINASGKTVK